MHHFESTKTSIHRLNRNSLADIRNHRKSFTAAMIEAKAVKAGNVWLDYKCIEGVNLPHLAGTPEETRDLCHKVQQN